MTRLHQSLAPNRPLIQIESIVAGFLLNKDHEYAIEHQEEDRVNQTSPYVLEWLFDAHLECIYSGDATKRKSAELVRYLLLIQLLLRLRNVDPARVKYWDYCEERLLSIV